MIEMETNRSGSSHPPIPQQKPIMNTAPTPIAEKPFVDRLLEKAQETAYQAVLAISLGDQAGARQLVDQLRFLRAAARLDRPLSEPAQSVSGADGVSTTMRCAMETLAIAEDVVRDWVAHRIGAVVAGEVSDPVEIWQCLIDQALPVSWDLDVDLFVVFGCPDATLQAALEQRGQRRVLVVHDADSAEPTGLPSGFRFASTDAQVLATLSQLDRPYPDPDRIASLSLHEAGDADPTTRAQTALIKKALLGLWMNVNTYQYFGKTWLEQGVGNIPLLATQHNLSELDGVFEGQPAVLISPGPSLEKNIDQIGALKGKALLLAPLQTLRRLHRANIRPDFLFVLDAADQTRHPLDFFGDVPDDFLPPLIAAANVHPAVLAKFRTVYVYSSGGPMDQWVEAAMGESLLTLMAPSVAIAGLLVACHWHCSPIMLTGQDLALKDGQQYAAGSQLKSLSNRRLYTLPGFHGGTVQSPSDYYMFHHRFEMIAKDMATQPAPLALFNCTEGGAFIQGYEHRSLQDVVASHLAHLSGDSIGARLSLLDRTDSGIQKRQDMVVLHLEKTLQLIDASVRRADQCRRLTMGVVTAGNKFLKKLAGEERQLRRLIKDIAGFSVLYQDDMDRALKAAAQATTLRENLDASRALYSLVSDGCAFLRPLVLQAIGQCSAWQQGTGGRAESPSMPASRVACG